MKLQVHHLASFSLSDNVSKTSLAGILSLPAHALFSSNNDAPAQQMFAMVPARLKNYYLPISLNNDSYEGTYNGFFGSCSSCIAGRM